MLRFTLLVTSPLISLIATSAVATVPKEDKSVSDKADKSESDESVAADVGVRLSGLLPPVSIRSLFPRLGT